MTPSLTLITEALTASGRPLGAYDLARILFCQPGAVCAEIENAIGGWWVIEKTAGAEGFLYGLRTVISPTKRMPKEVEELCDEGINKRSPWMTT